MSSDPDPLPERLSELRRRLEVSRARAGELTELVSRLVSEAEERRRQREGLARAGGGPPPLAGLW